MVKCGLCDLDMSETDSCMIRVIIFEGREYKRLAGFMGSEPDGKRCRDCAILKIEGNAHHDRCDAEMCPICRRQMIGCECEWGYRKI